MVISPKFAHHLPLKTGGYFRGCIFVMRVYWWKILSILLLVYTFTAGFMIRVPDIGNLQQTIRNFFFHVPMWFSQLVLITVSLVYSIKYLRKPDPVYDMYAAEFARTGTVLGCLGLITGAIWATYTWGAGWRNVLSCQLI